LEIKKITNKLLYIGPHIEPNIILNRKKIIEIFSNKKILIDNSNYDLIPLDIRLREVSEINKIDYISKIFTINFNFKKDFFIDSKLTFSDANHWSQFGEIYFGKKLVYNSKIKNILF
jgi:hypothetical protein